MSQHLPIAWEKGIGTYGRIIATYITRIEYCCVFTANLRENITLIHKETMHISDVTQILLVSGGLADGLPPFFNRLEYTVLDSR